MNKSSQSSEEPRPSLVIVQNWFEGLRRLVPVGVDWNESEVVLQAQI